MIGEIILPGRYMFLILSDGTSFVASAGDQLSGDCANLDLQIVSCGVESSSTWNPFQFKT